MDIQACCTMSQRTSLPNSETQVSLIQEIFQNETQINSLIRHLDISYQTIYAESNVT